ncbi:MAG: NADPH-dependent FMN reductase [Sphingomonadales bacterium 63-6]|mgnify:CR=1 FL=1|nr:MAG: NADPH-dependent FMN reductase [Sphingomonadales bacterium 63-6]
MSHIAIIPGSLRKESYNRRLARAIAHLPATEGHSFEIVEIGDLPLYDQDTDSDQPEPARRMKDRIRAADGVIFVTPEYNRSIPGVLKNAIDHGSRPYGDSCWGGKPAGVLGVTPGISGTAMAQQHLRNVLVSLNMPALQQPEVFLKWSDDLVDEDGRVGKQAHDLLEGWMKAFLAHVERHKDADIPQFKQK